VIPDSETPTLVPAIVKLVARELADPALEVAFTVRLALPVPLAGVTLAHAAALEAVHEQLDPFAVTVIVPLPPADPNGLPLAEASTVTLHAMPPCEIWYVCPPMESAPERATVVEFAATVYARFNGPGPVPLPLVEIVIQVGPGTVV
jgi:hypothetical protein